MNSLKGFSSADIVAYFSHEDGGILRVKKSQFVLVLVLLPHGDATVLCPILGDEKFEAVPENHSPAIVIRGSRAGLIDPACIRAERFKPLPKFAVAKGDYDFFP